LRFRLGLALLTGWGRSRLRFRLRLRKFEEKCIRVSRRCLFGLRQWKWLNQYFLTDILPKKEDYGLTSQLRRSALSVFGNIAEAFGRYHVSDKINFYYYSRGSMAETMSHLEYGTRVGYFKPEDVESIHSRLETLYESINRLIKSLKVKYKTGNKP